MSIIKKGILKVYLALCLALLESMLNTKPDDNNYYTFKKIIFKRLSNHHYLPV